MFSTTGLFKSIACPKRDKCTLINCIFSHNAKIQPSAETKAETDQYASVDHSQTDEDSSRSIKRRKLEDAAAVSQGLYQQPHVKHAADLNNDRHEISHVSSNQNNPSKGSESSAKTTTKPVSLKRAITPPPPRPAKALKTENGTVPVRQPPKKESLNPRMLPQPPTGHDKRALYLKHMHDQMARLNMEVLQSALPQKAALNLDAQELITAAVDEEEETAKTQGAVYANIMKNRIAAYKKMQLDQWIDHVKANIIREKQTVVITEKALPPPLETGLPLNQEYLILSHLISDQEPLAKQGYVVEPPTESEIDQANHTIQLAMNFEVCDRCKTRFQVFPERRACDGAITTNGPCIHHWARPRRPQAQKTDAVTGSRDPIHPCCGEPTNSKGCSEAPHHVFKIVEPARMAFITPFIRTPDNPKPAKGPNGKTVRAVTFDCEMGYTTLGMEMIRLTAVSWPDNAPLIDVLVRPKGAILDLNSRFSGVWPENLLDAQPYDPDKPFANLGPDEKLRVLETPEAARSLLCKFLTPSTPLIGHALENDLNTIRLVHRSIIDTVVLYPHPRGLPMRFGLKMLTKKYLDRDIQTGGERGHDSLEDARATGDLVRRKVGSEWRKMKENGWRIEEGKLIVPSPRVVWEDPASEGGDNGHASGEVRPIEDENGNSGEIDEPKPVAKDDNADQDKSLVEW